MRLSEKTLELTLCSQMSDGIRNPIWFGLTQRQEAKAGFDAATQIGGMVFLFQFKASNKVIRGAKRFHLPHKQLDNLQRLAQGNRKVFYVLPMIGTTSELASNPDVLASTWLLDVATLPPIPQPTIMGGSRRRKSETHYLDCTPPTAILRSDPIGLDLKSAKRLRSEFLRPELVEGGSNSVGDDWSKYLDFTGNACGLIIPV